MSGLFSAASGGGGNTGPQTNLQVQTSANGNPLPIVYGTPRISGNLIWYGGFHYTASPSGGSGKGGTGGGGKGGSSGSYNYYASWQMGLSEGPIEGIGYVWSNGNKETAAYYGLTISDGAYSQTPWTYLLSNYGYLNESHTIPASSPYQVQVTYHTDFMADNGVTGPLSLSQVTGAPSSGHYSIQIVNGVYTLTFPSAYAGETVKLSNAQYTNSFTIPSSAPYTVQWSVGGAPQSVVLTSATYTKAAGTPSSGEYYTDGTGTYTFNSAQAGDAVIISYASNTQTPGFNAMGYSGVAWAGAPNYSLGTSPSLPNFNFELKGIYSASVTGSPDADPSLVVADFLTNAKYGVGYPSGKLGDLTNYQNYTLAQGLLVSFHLDTQSPANTILMDLAACTNSAWAMVDGKLNLVPYGDVDLTGNGKSYTAPSAALYSLTDDDFIRSKGQDPIQLNHKRPSDQINWIQMSFSNRDIEYNPDTVEYKNEVWINKFKIRPMPTSSMSNDYFCDSAAAQTSVNLQGQRQLVLNEYSFTLDQRYIVLDVMDIVEISSDFLKLTNQWVRITAIQENSDYTLSITAEEYLGGSGTAPSNSFPSSGGYSTNFNVSPGNVNVPVIFAAPVQIATNTGLQIWMVVSGEDANYGGTQVWASSDDNNYKQIGSKITGNSREGLIVTDSDTSMTVDMTESGSQLLGGSAIDAQLGNTLCIAQDSNGNFELFSYTTALLESTAYNYTLSGLQRGLYGTAQVSWSTNTMFARLDSQTFIMPYNKNQIGQDIYLKFLAFNKYGGGQQQLTDVEPYIYNVQGPPLPPDVTGFSVQQAENNSVVFKWDEVIDFGLKGYDIRYAAQGTSSWDLFTPLTESTAGTEMTNAAVPPGTWTFAIRARDIADQLSPDTTTADLVVANNNSTVTVAVQEPLWNGTYSGFGLHYTGVLYPKGTKAPYLYSSISPPSTPTLGQTAGGALAGTTYYVVITYVGSGTETTASGEASYAVTTNNLLTVTSPPASGNALGYNVYVSTTSGAETKQNSSYVPIGTDWTLSTAGVISGAALPTRNNTGWEVFDSYCPDPISTASYTAPTLDTGFDANLRVWFKQTLTPGMGVVGTPDYQEYIDTWLTGATDPNTYQPWIIGTADFRYLNARITETPSSVPSYLSEFTVNIDTSPLIENASSVSVASGGTAVTFPNKYHITPNVQITVVAGTGLYATAADITTTGFIAHVFNSSGSDVGGTVNWTATGE